MIDRSGISWRETPPRRPEASAWLLTARVAAFTYSPLMLVPALVATAAILDGQLLAVPAVLLWLAAGIATSYLVLFCTAFLLRGRHWAGTLLVVVTVAVLAVDLPLCWWLLGVDGLIRDGAPLVVAAALTVYGIHRATHPTPPPGPPERQHRRCCCLGRREGTTSLMLLLPVPPAASCPDLDVRPDDNSEPGSLLCFNGRTGSGTIAVRGVKQSKGGRAESAAQSRRGSGAGDSGTAGCFAAGRGCARRVRRGGGRGGPAGAAAALAARRAGAEVLLLDRAEFPRDKACGDGIAAHALDVLAELGVRDAVDGFAPVPALRLVAPDGGAVARALPRPAYTVPRQVFDARLTRRADESGPSPGAGIGVRPRRRSARAAHRHRAPTRRRSARCAPSPALSTFARRGRAGCFSPATRSR